MTSSQMEKFLLEFKDAWLDFPFGPETRVYKYGPDKMFAIIQDGTNPLRVSLRCDTQLAELLRSKYETVIPGVNLSAKHWITIICSGQLDDSEIEDLARLSYGLVSAN